MRLLRKSEVLEMVGVSYPTIWRWVRDGKFPAPRTIGATTAKDGVVRWVESEVRAWIEDLPKREYPPANAQLIPSAKLDEMQSNTKRYINPDK